MKCSECKEFINNQTCKKCEEDIKSVIMFWNRHEYDNVYVDIKDGDCLYYSKIEEEEIIHRLKTLPRYFKAVVKGEKTFEVRKDDRDFQTGDTLLLQKFDNGQYLKDIYKCKITYILGRNDDEKIFVKKGYVILGIK